MDDASPAETLHTESHDPAVPAAYSAFMRTGWGDRELDLPAHPVTSWAAARRQRVADRFPGERVVVPSGGFKVRANDTDYRFRASSDHAWLTGNQTSDAVLVIEGGESVLYARPRSPRDTDEFFRDRQYGELWVGRRPSLRETSDSLGIAVRHIDDLPAVLAAGGPTRVLRGYDAVLDAQVPPSPSLDDELARVLSQLRLIKDAWEVAELQGACDTTTLGFEDCVREWDDVLKYGERWVEGTFFRRARAMGNDIGYDSIVGGGRHATTLHWIDNTGPMTPGELVLLDMGAEATSLYTADVSRTLPISGRWTAIQRDLYSLVLDAQTQAIAEVRPGKPIRGGHHKAMEVIVHGLDDLDLLPVSVDEALDEDSKVYTRWTLHGVSHMLGLDVHDCASSDPDVYPRGDLEEGMVLTVEPGLYFQEDDKLVPEELRGIGIRIEDDILVTSEGPKNLSEALPRDPDEIEAWMDALRR